MKKLMLVLMATTIFAAALPAFAAEHGSGHDPADLQCARECEMLLRNCQKDVDSIQQRIKKLQSSIKKDGADQARLEEVKALQKKLADANDLLKSLVKPGR